MDVTIICQILEVFDLVWVDTHLGAKGFKSDDQLRQQRQGSQQGNQHGQCCQKTKINAGNKIRQGQDQKAADNCQ